MLQKQLQLQPILEDFSREGSQPPLENGEKSTTEFQVEGMERATPRTTLIRDLLGAKKRIAPVLFEKKGELEVDAEQKKEPVLSEKKGEMEVDAELEQKKEGVIEPGSVFVLAMCQSY